jgi:hypothetical protein
MQPSWRLACGFWLGVVFSCTRFDPNGAPPIDVGLPTGASDASVADGSDGTAADATAESPCRSGPHVFCDDFDRGNFSQWQLAMSDGILEITDTAAVSAPFSLRAKSFDGPNAFISLKKTLFNVTIPPLGSIELGTGVRVKYTAGEYEVDLDNIIVDVE